MFGVKLSDYHNRMKRATSRSSNIINFDAINRRQFNRARCNRHEKLAPKSGVTASNDYVSIIRGFDTAP